MVEEGGLVPQPPPLDAHSKEVLEWYNENETDYARMHGLMEGLIRETGLEGERKSVFIRKLDVIYCHAMRKAAEEARGKTDA